VRGAEGLLPDGEGAVGEGDRLAVAALIEELHHLPIERLRLAKLILLNEGLIRASQRGQ